MSVVVVRLSSFLQTKKGAWCAAFIWMMVIFAFSAQPHSGDITEQFLHDWNFSVRKCAHMCEYAMLFLLFRNSTRVTWPGAIALLPFLLTVLYSMSDEFHQMFVPGRTATIHDVVFDSSGAAVAWLVLTLWQRWRQDKQ